MKKTLLLSVVGLATAIMTGCSSVESGTKFSGMYVTENKAVPLAHINGTVWGVYMFGALPLFSGNTFNIGKSAYFKDTINISDAVSMVTRTGRGLEATKVIDIQTDYTTEWLWYSLIFWKKEIQVSGTAIK